jgi:hypothetical protein
VLGKVSRPPPEKYAKWSGLELEARYWRLIGKSDVDLEDKFNDVSLANSHFYEKNDSTDLLPVLSFLVVALMFCPAAIQAQHFV